MLSLSSSRIGSAGLRLRHLHLEPLTSQSHRIATNRTIVRSLNDKDVPVISPPAAVALASLALFSASTSSATAHELVMQLASTEGDIAHTIEVVLRPLLTLYTMLYIVRIPMTWYPDVDGNKFPWSLVVAPTEPFLSPIRSTIGVGGVGGVDVSPIICVSLVSFLQEILIGPQGLLMLIQIQSTSSGY